MNHSDQGNSLPDSSLPHICNCDWMRHAGKRQIVFAFKAENDSKSDNLTEFQNWGYKK